MYALCIGCNHCEKINVQKIEDHRKKWDLDEYEEVAKRRLEEELQAELGDKGKKEPPVRRELLKPRDYKVGKQKYPIPSSKLSNICNDECSLLNQTSMHSA